jgi:hypothetical protein
MRSGIESWFLGDVDSSFGLHRSQASSSFKMLVSQELEEVEVPYIKALPSPTISLPFTKSYVDEVVDVA